MLIRKSKCDQKLNFRVLSEMDVFEAKVLKGSASTLIDDQESAEIL